jgi:uncharacterized repeat protein (TIGR03809 family)
MSERPPARALDQVAQKWRDLAERRRAHFIELYRSGRWKRYYSEERFLHHMRAAILGADAWAQVAPRPEATAGVSTPASGVPRTAA